MLRRRIQLGLVHVALTITLLPINSTLNRVMIKELALSATLVAVLASLPYLISPIQVSIGAYADRHRLWGFQRTPFILLGPVSYRHLRAYETGRKLVCRLMLEKKNSRLRGRRGRK